VLTHRAGFSLALTHSSTAKPHCSVVAKICAVHLDPHQNGRPKGRPNSKHGAIGEIARYLKSRSGCQRFPLSCGVNFRSFVPECSCFLRSPRVALDRFRQFRQRSCIPTSLIIRGCIDAIGFPAAGRSRPLARMAVRPGTSTNENARRVYETRRASEFLNGGGGTRTHDPRLMNPQDIKSRAARGAAVDAR
jgi:hypothetical protein